MIQLHIVCYFITYSYCLYISLTVSNLDLYKYSQCVPYPWLNGVVWYWYGPANSRSSEWQSHVQDRPEKVQNETRKGKGSTRRPRAVLDAQGQYSHVIIYQQLS